MIKYMKSKKFIVALIMIIISSVFVIGADWASKTVHRLFHSYFADIVIPFGYYLLLVLLEDKFEPMKKWYIKAGAVFTLCAVSEILQYFGVYALARVFDPMDFVMYALGTVLAIFVDRILFKKVFKFWN